MANISFIRQIHITPLYKEVKNWCVKNNDEGFLKLTEDLCEKFSQIDSEWMGEEGWGDAIDQYVYAEFLSIKGTEKVQEAVTIPMVEQLQTYKNGKTNLCIRSCEDDFCLEILASDVMVRYCVTDNAENELWKLVVKETAIMTRLYELNGKGEKAFWKDLLNLNKHLQVIIERPMVKLMIQRKDRQIKNEVKEEVLLSYEYDTSQSLPLEIDDNVELMIGNQIKTFYVINKKFSYAHPLGKLGEIQIFLQAL